MPLKIVSTVERIVGRILGCQFSWLVFMVCIALSLGSTGAGAVPPPLGWNVDRINQAGLPLDGITEVGPLSGSGVDIYVFDTGVRLSHEQFGGRAIAGIDISWDGVDEGKVKPGDDCDGHGTHVAGIAGGSTVGVAKAARLISVRVLDCEGNGDIAGVVEGINWVIAHHESGKLAVANLSLGVDLDDKDGTILNAAVRELIDDGVVVVAAAGNGDGSGKPFDACKIAPPSEPASIVVGATDIFDHIGTYSNYGPCVDIFAPGGDGAEWVESSWKNKDDEYQLDRGTSMAAPLVAGYAALLIQQQPRLCVSQISRAIVNRSTRNVVQGLNSKTPNRFLKINTRRVTTTQVPGRPTNVHATPDDGSIVVTWDKPCNGTSQIQKNIVRVYNSAGNLVRTVSLAAGQRATRISGLRNGGKYSVSVQSVNALGAGKTSVRSLAVMTRAFSVGDAIKTSSLFPTQNDARSVWEVLPESAGVCEVRKAPQRLVAIKTGACRVLIAQQYDPSPRTHTFSIGD